MSDTYSYRSKGKINSERYSKKSGNLVQERIENYRQLFKDSNGELINSTSKTLKGLKRFEANSDSQALMYMNSDTTHGKILKFADQMLKFPKKERFNQDLDESVKDVK